MSVGKKIVEGVAVCTAVAALCGCDPETGPLVLAERGKPSAYAVVVPAEATPCVRHAAEELTNYVFRLTGVALPVADAAPEKGHAVFLRSGGPNPESAFRFAARGRDFEIAGDGDRALLFGVYDFLETMCGCEWLTSDQDIVPSLEKIAVAENLSVERKPSFVNRECGWTDAYEHPDFAAKLKLNGYRYARVYGPKQGGKPPAFDSVLSICHTFQAIFPTEKYFKDHPEYYAEVDGKRLGEGRVQLCLSNPEVVEKAIAFVKERIRRSYPAVKCYGVSQSDTQGYCTCPKCKAIDDREGSPSGSIVTFVNKIADAVRDEWPDVIIETLAYMYSRPAPKTLKCRDNVMITLCTDTCDLSRPLLGNRFRWRGQPAFTDDLHRWQQIARHIYVWDYAVNFRYLWHAYPSLMTLKPNYEFFAENGVTHGYMEGCHHGRRAESSEIKLWLVSHLMWDPHQPFEPLFDRFLRGYYGPAAPFARRYYEEMDKLQQDESKTPQMMWGRLDSPALPDEFFERAAGWWREALAAVKGDAVREKNVRWSMNFTDYTRIMRQKPELDVRSPRFAELRDAARRIVADFDAETWAEGLKCFGEETAIGKESIERLRRLAAMDVGREEARQAKGRFEVRTRLLDFIPGVNFSGADAFDGKGPSSVKIEKKQLILAGPADSLGFSPYPYEPVRPFSGPSLVTLKADGLPAGSRAVLRLKERSRGAKPVEFAAPLENGFAFFETNLDQTREYVFAALDFTVPGKAKAMQKVTVDKLEGLVRTDEANAFTLEVVTHSPLHVVDFGSKEEPRVALHNAAMTKAAAKGALVVSDFYGRSFELPFDVNLEPGKGCVAVRVPRTPGKAEAKGVWRVEAKLTGADGSTAVRTDRFAVLDPHPATPKVPYGKFRMGVHCHSARWRADEADLTHDAAVRMGAKIVRIDDVFSQFATWDRARNDFDFTKADRFLEGLEKRGLAVDAIIQENGFNRFTEDFCARLAQHYGERIDYYEVGNEWDLASAEWLTPAKAVDWQRLAYRGLKRGNAKARVTTNGWAVEDSNGHANVTQKGFQEQFMKEAKGAYDIHAMHLHFAFQNYVERMGRFFKLRQDCGVTEPFVLNETALSVQYRGEEEVAENVWLKVIYGWAHGATDYIWYNMRASQFDPGGVYGVISRDFRPRLTYAAFSGLAAALGDHDFDKTIVEKEGRKAYRFRRRSGKEIVLAGWDTGAMKPVSVDVETDAKRVFVADVMNNRREAKPTGGKVSLPLTGTPQAWVFEDATFAKPSKEILAASKAPPRVILVSPVRPDYGWDLLLDRYAQVHEEYPADPATAHRTWKGKDDCSGILLFSLKDGRPQVYVSVRDEKDTPGDAVQIWRDGKDVTASLNLRRTRHGDGRTTYEGVWPDTETCRLNVRFVDDDGFGGKDGWIDYAPFDAKKPDISAWPLLRFATREEAK